MLNGCRQIRICAALAIICGGLCGCADTGSIDLPFPDLSSSERVKSKLLSQEEKDAAIGELTRDQESHRDAAIEQIEQREKDESAKPAQTVPPKRRTL